MAISQDDSLTHFVQASVFHRYEYALEFAFKTMQSYLAIQDDFETDFNVIVFKAMKNGLIEDEEIWKRMLEDSSLNGENYTQADYTRIHSAILNEYFPQIKVLVERL